MFLRHCTSLRSPIDNGEFSDYTLLAENIAHDEFEALPFACKLDNFIVFERFSQQVFELYLSVRHVSEPGGAFSFYLFISVYEFVKRSVNLVVQLFPDLPSRNS